MVQFFCNQNDVDGHFPGWIGALRSLAMQVLMGIPERNLVLPWPEAELKPRIIAGEPETILNVLCMLVPLLPHQECYIIVDNPHLTEGMYQVLLRVRQLAHNLREINSPQSLRLKVLVTNTHRMPFPYLRRYDL